MLYLIVIGWNLKVVQTQISCTALVEIRVAADFQGLVRRRLAPKPSHSERWDVCIPWAETWDTCWLPSQWKVQPDELWCDIPSRRTKWITIVTTFLMDVGFNFIQFLCGLVGKHASEAPCSSAMFAKATPWGWSGGTAAHPWLGTFARPPSLRHLPHPGVVNVQRPRIAGDKTRFSS